MENREYLNQMKKMQILTIIMIIAIFIFIPKNTKAYNENNEINTDMILEEQQSSFGIRDFLKEAENNSPDFVKDLDISDIFNSALTGKIDNSNILKKILNLAGVQVLDTLKILINILLIVLIHSILKSITDGLENGEVSKIVYYVQYVLIVTIIMANFTDILKSVKDTIENLVGFSGSLVPLLVTLMTYIGSITTTAVIEPILLFMIEFITNMIKTLVIPIISIITVLIIISKITDKVQISKLGNFLKSSVVWVLGIILTIFVGVVSLEGSLTSSVDGVTAKTAKAAVSSLIPIVRQNIRRWS
jgi:stage III sporulation protein AE